MSTSPTPSPTRNWLALWFQVGGAIFSGMGCLSLIGALLVIGAINLFAPPDKPPTGYDSSGQDAYSVATAPFRALYNETRCSARLRVTQVGGVVTRLFPPPLSANSGRSFSTFPNAFDTSHIVSRYTISVAIRSSFDAGSDRSQASHQLAYHRSDHSRSGANHRPGATSGRLHKCHPDATRR
jgi:hypothetical protein